MATDRMPKNSHLAKCSFFETFDSLKFKIIMKFGKNNICDLYKRTLYLLT